MENFARTALKTAAAAALLAAPAALAATPLVVRSAGPSAKSYPPGRAVGENTPVILKAGDVVTVLAPSGARTLRGPGTFKVAGGGGAPAFNARSRFSAMRGPEVPPSPGLWDVDVSKSGNVCLSNPAQVVLWHPAPAADATLQVTPSAGGAAGAALAAAAADRRRRRIFAEMDRRGGADTAQVQDPRGGRRRSDRPGQGAHRQWLRRPARPSPEGRAAGVTGGRARAAVKRTIKRTGRFVTEATGPAMRGSHSTQWCRPYSMMCAGRKPLILFLIT